MNGKYLTPRDKGPLWVIYPRDEFAELNTKEVDHRMSVHCAEALAKSAVHRLDLLELHPVGHPRRRFRYRRMVARHRLVLLRRLQQTAGRLRQTAHELLLLQGGASPHPGYRTGLTLWPDS